MIILDTNVISEAIKPQPSQAVQAWFDAQDASTLFLTSVTLAELWYGIGALPAGRRRQSLAKAVDGLIALFLGRILAFDTDSARHHAASALRARAAGQGLPAPDAYIAAIAAASRYAVATRDAAPFRAAGVAVIDPWQFRPR
ncbi:MAG: PIN domain-containing protein [Betaproteobacteria bacterium]|nr:PIN domain-containing protein [Betaproteobacteria bacterium]